MLRLVIFFALFPLFAKLVRSISRSIERKLPEGKFKEFATYPTGLHRPWWIKEKPLREWMLILVSIALPIAVLALIGLSFKE